MNEVLGPASNLLAAGIVAYVLLRNVKAPPAAAPAPQPAPAEPSLQDLIASLDKPRDRAFTINMGRKTLEQFSTNDTVGIIVIAVELDITHAHLSAIASQKIYAIDVLLDSIDRHAVINRAATNACRRALGLPEAAP